MSADMEHELIAQTKTVEHVESLNMTTDQFYRWMHANVMTTGTLAKWTYSDGKFCLIFLFPSNLFTITQMRYSYEKSRRRADGDMLLILGKHTI